MKKKLLASVDLQPVERLEVGKYTITKYQDEDFWIKHESGEGMQVFKRVFEKLIDDFYKNEF